MTIYIGLLRSSEEEMRHLGIALELSRLSWTSGKRTRKLAERVRAAEASLGSRVGVSASSDRKFECAAPTLARRGDGRARFPGSLAGVASGGARRRVPASSSRLDVIPTHVVDTLEIGGCPPSAVWGLTRL